MNLEPAAIERIKSILAEENNPALKLRVFIEGGGCSGFSQGFTLDEEQSEDDFDLDFDGVKVLVDPMSWQYLQEATIGFKEDVMGANFVINVPNATGRCGCGNSFSM